MKNKYLAYDSISSEYEEFETIEEARQWLFESFYQEGLYTDELVNCKIYKLVETADYDVVDKKSNYLYESEDEAPEDSEGDTWPHSTEFDEVWEHKFVKV